MKGKIALEGRSSAATWPDREMGVTGMVAGGIHDKISGLLGYDLGGVPGPNRWVTMIIRKIRVYYDGRKRQTAFSS